MDSSHFQLHVGPPELLSNVADSYAVLAVVYALAPAHGDVQVLHEGILTTLLVNRNRLSGWRAWFLSRPKKTQSFFRWLWSKMPECQLSSSMLAPASARGRLQRSAFTRTPSTKIQRHCLGVKWIRDAASGTICSSCINPCSSVAWLKIGVTGVRIAYASGGGWEWIRHTFICTSGPQNS